MTRKKKKNKKKKKNSNNNSNNNKGKVQEKEKEQEKKLSFTHSVKATTAHDCGGADINHHHHHHHDNNNNNNKITVFDAGDIPGGVHCCTGKVRMLPYRSH